MTSKTIVQRENMRLKCTACMPPKPCSDICCPVKFCDTSARIAYICPRRLNTLFARTDRSYLHGDRGVAVRGRGDLFPEMCPSPCPGRKDLRRIHAYHGRRRGVRCIREA